MPGLGLPSSILLPSLIIKTHLQDSYIIQCMQSTGISEYLFNNVTG